MDDLRNSSLHIKLRKKERIPSYYTTEEIKVIENSVSRSSALGKRNYAMILLASRLGLRASDIMSLKFSDIDWDNDLIRLRIQKTGKTIELPLLADVGNAIIDYLRYGRPASTSQTYFYQVVPRILLPLSLWFVVISIK